MARNKHVAIPVSELPQNRRAPKPVPKLSMQQRLALAGDWLRVGVAWARRVFALLLRVLVAAAVVAGVVAVSRLVERHLHASPSFAIEHIEVRGNQQLSREAVIEGAGLALGKNVFDVGPEEVKRRLLQVAWIESVSVRRRLPGTYSIELRERRAVALLALSELFLVSDDGVAFKPLAAGDPYDLPVITGIDAAQVAQDRRASATALMSAVGLLHDYQDAGLWRREAISEIHIEPEGTLSLYIGADATHVRLGKPPFRQKLERLREVMTQLSSQKTRAAYVLLDNQRRLDRVTVRLR
jgi:cell division protein FtsQ